jgi:hypothetical protein
MAVGLPESDCPMPMVGFRPFGLVGESATNRLPSSYAEIAQRLLKEVAEVTTQAAKARTVEDFKERRKRLYPEYLSLMKALSSVVLAKMDQCDRTSLMINLQPIFDASFEALEDDMETHGALYFSDDVLKEIMFSLATIKSAYLAVPRLLSAHVDEAKLDQDRELGENFSFSVTWAQFHFEALKGAMRKNLTVVPEVLLELTQGLRSSVMAYSYIRQAVGLRGLLDERYSEDLGPLVWDDEDEALAHSE